MVVASGGRFENDKPARRQSGVCDCRPRSHRPPPSHQPPAPRSSDPSARHAIPAANRPLPAKPPQDRRFPTASSAQSAPRTSPPGSGPHWDATRASAAGGTHSAAPRPGTAPAPPPPPRISAGRNESPPGCPETRSASAKHCRVGSRPRGQSLPSPSLSRWQTLSAPSAQPLFFGIDPTLWCISS